MNIFTLVFGCLVISLTSGQLLPFVPLGSVANSQDAKYNTLSEAGFYSQSQGEQLKRAVESDDVKLITEEVQEWSPQVNNNRNNNNNNVEIQRAKNAAQGRWNKNEERFIFNEESKESELDAKVPNNFVPINPWFNGFF